jgi:hypothetical protein
MTDDRIYWHIPQRVVIMKAARDATIEIVRADTKQLNELVGTGIAPVHLIVDVSNIGMIPPDVEMTDEILSLFSSPQIGHAAMIGLRQQDLQMLKSARDAVSQVTGKPIAFANNIAEALAIFKEHDSSLDV